MTSKPPTVAGSLLTARDLKFNVDKTFSFEDDSMINFSSVLFLCLSKECLRLPVQVSQGFQAVFQNQAGGMVFITLETVDLGEWSDK